MLIWLRSLLIFGAMVATPFVLEAILTRHSEFLARVSRSVSDYAYPVSFTVLVVVVLILALVLHDKLQRIANYLTVAERDLNNLLSSGLEHGGRKARVAERSEWNLMNVPADIQVFEEGYRTVAHELIAQNEKELGNKGAAIGKATTTAFLLRELYEGNVDAAQSKIVADTKNTGTAPYVAPGIRELVGFDRFSAETGFPSGSGVGEIFLEMTVLLWGFPKHILMVKTNSAGERSEFRNEEVLADLTMQKP